MNYSITNARVGRRTDYERLNLEIWTNGTVIPEDAVAYAAKIIKEQLTVFINFDEEEVDAIVEVEDDTEISGTEEILFTSIEDMDLSARSLNCLRKAEIAYVGELIQKTEEDLLNLENFGKRSLLEIRERIEEMDLVLGSTIDVEAFESEKLKKLEAEES